VFLLLLCNDKAVLGPWVNAKKLNLFTGAIIWILVMLSVILTATTVFPEISGATILSILGGGTVFALLGYGITLVLQKSGSKPGVKQSMKRATVAYLHEQKQRQGGWRMPPIEELPAPNLTMSKRVWMGILRGYLLVAVGLVIVKVVQMMLH